MEPCGVCPIKGYMPFNMSWPLALRASVHLCPHCVVPNALAACARVHTAITYMSRATRPSMGGQMWSGVLGVEFFNN